ncbi:MULTISPECIES: lipopolysaccharide transport periplasmic protein LptA [Pseudomonas]|uniref:Lipopolysaccharide export system protein LptA n=2 Tax=Ectopseudomonas TaxID=3236654 RepID=A0A653B6T8_ECTOL|nr:MULTISPECIES: lipopolysaccharide transport periplasmic protein LptA [Pseudomonas]TNF15667.1 MAG: lipopolysaccharide transport periplasmic protein LptA [Pseudomonadales bacterium]CAE6896845.1 Lipopolysaccharide export system protein LptA [Pseudomonas oleovorans]QFT20831.1 Lipopolysaccharide export system protein LptA precursor [Pseudomonas sp. THAF187a]QFT41020.1 Lipopolysaccharide export system protein LptA precursor [Pseudomonas sp. THAF42]WFC61220.1 lipopolysaccharide transport periplasmi|tara:strand:- start:23747 stop:24289 length:543 start_codon:yes stop_codon:yes gene_type:complete
MRFVNTLPLILSLGAALGSAAAWALPSDRDQPIRIQADTAELDDKQGVAVYRGDVIITQGTLKITGDTVTITQTASGDIDVFTSVGNLAYYEQKPDVDKDIVKAYGKTIQYFASNERIVLIDQAKVIQEGNTFEGEKIVYDTRRQIVNAGRATGSNVSTPRPRIDMVIQPKNKPADQAQQ